MAVQPSPLLDQLDDTDATSDDTLDEIALLHQFQSLPDRQPSQLRCPKKGALIFLFVATVASVLVVLLVLKLGLPVQKGDGKLRRVRFLHISDTHLDLYYDSTVTNKNKQQCRNKPLKKTQISIENLNSTCAFGRLGCDSPLQLLQSLGDELNRISKQLKDDGGKLDFILITGDQVAHAYGLFQVDILNSVLWSITNSTSTISNAVPGVPVLMCVGNNDLTIDYEPPVTSHSAFYRLLYNQLERYIFPKPPHENSTARAEVQQTFEFGGYYSMAVTESTTLVVLNTNYWSGSAYSLNSDITAIGDEQLIWLGEQLRRAEMNKQRVVISGHIPPGISTYSGKSLWLKNYTEAYVALVARQFPRVVIAQLYGHTHQDKIRIQLQKQEQQSGNTSNTAMNSFILTCPSITPMYGNNPAFRMYTFNEAELNSLDYTQYYLDLAASNVDKRPYWLTEYSFRDTYKVKLSSAGVEKVVNELLQPRSSAWLHYSQHMVAGGGGVTNNLRYREFCGACYYTVRDYRNCLARFIDAGVS